MGVFKGFKEGVGGVAVGFADRWSKKGYRCGFPYPFSFLPQTAKTCL